MRKIKYYSIAETSKLLNVTAQTLRNWDKSGKLKPHHTTDSGYRYYSQEQLNRVLGVKDTTRKVIGYELIEYIATLYNCDIEVIDTTEKTEQQELVEDMIQIITVFSCKLQGKKANKTKKMIKELIEDDTSEES